MPTRNGKERASKVPEELPRNRIGFLQQCYIPKELLKEKNIMIFVQETQHGQLTQEFTQLHQINNVRRFEYSTGMDRLHDLRIYGMDMERIIEFLSSLNKEGKATVTNLQGEKISFKVTQELVSEATEASKQRICTWYMLDHQRQIRSIQADTRS